MGKAEEYRRFAAECLLISEGVRDANCKMLLLDMANVWLQLADLADKNSRTDLVYETPPSRPGNP